MGQKEVADIGQGNVILLEDFAIGGEFVTVTGIDGDISARVCTR
jgi:hypothetical protein